MATLVVVRVTYTKGVATSVSVPTEPFTGDTAAIEAASFVKKNFIIPKDAANRTEFHVVPVGSQPGRGALDLVERSAAAPHRDYSTEDQTGVRIRHGRKVTRRLGRG